MLNECSEIVVDTNVFMHASNTICEYSSSAVDLMAQLIESKVLLCVDDIFDSNEALNTSHIASEYFRFLVPGSIGHTTLLAIISNGRVKSYCKKDFTSQKRRITKMIRDKTDVVFICIAYASSDKTLISNDFEDMVKKKRKVIYKDFNVNTITSIQATAQ